MTIKEFLTNGGKTYQLYAPVIKVPTYSDNKYMDNQNLTEQLAELDPNVLDYYKQSQADKEPTKNLG